MKTQQKKSPIQEVYDSLNQLYSANFSCLRVASQDKPIAEKPMVQTSRDVFGNKTLKDIWLKEKLSAVNKDRLELLTTMQEHTTQLLDDNYLQTQFEYTKLGFMDVFNSYYKTNKTFEECFDGFEILDPVFKKDFEAFDLNALTPTKFGLNLILHLYYQYLDFFEQYKCAIAFKDILQVLSDDITPYGYRSMFYGKPTNSNVELLTQEKFKKLITQVGNAKTETDQALAQAEQECKILEKKAGRKNSPISQRDVAEKRKVVTQLKILKNKSDKLAYFSSIISARHESANQDYDNTTISSFCESILDFASGVSVFDKNQSVEVDQIYIHKAEIECINHFISSYKKCKEITDSMLNQSTLS